MELCQYQVRCGLAHIVTQASRIYALCYIAFRPLAFGLYSSSSPPPFFFSGAGKNLYRLLESGQSALLFPGGVREAYRRKGEEYSLFWPSKPEFIRMAARHDALIVPFAGVGLDDSFKILLDGEEIRGK